MAAKSDDELASILARLASARTHEEEEEIGRGELASWLFHASPALIDQLLNRAKRDNRLRGCLSAARHYSGLGQEKCEQIDALLRAPFPAAQRPRRKHRRA